MSARGVRHRFAGAAGAFVDTARSPDLRRAQLAFAAAWTAEWAFTVSLSVYAYRQGGAAAVGGVALGRMLPSAVAAPLLTPYADRWPRDRVLVGVSAVRGAATALAALLVALGAAAVSVYVLAALSTVAATLYRPAHSALLPSLCRSPRELAGANVVRGLLDSLATLVGPLLAGVLLAVGDVGTAFAGAALASGWSAALMLRVHARVPQPRPVARRRVGPEIAEGVRAVRGDPGLRRLVRLTMAQTFTRGTLTVFTVVVALDLLDTGDAGVAALTAAVGAGAVLGSFAAALLVGSRRLARWFGVGVSLWGLPLAAVAADLGELPTLLLLAVVGIGNALVDVGLFTLMARLAPDAVLARVFGLLECLIAVAVGVGAIVTPVAIALLGLQSALVVLGLVGPVSVAASWAGLARLDDGMGVQDDAIGLLREVPMLRPLALPAIEAIARGLEPVAVPGGRAVFSQGDEGDRFFVIESGVAEVVGDGRVVATLAAGEAFGEIALLRRVPRTATVRAVTDLRLQALRGDRFRYAVGGVAASSEAAAAGIVDLLDRFSPKSPERAADG